MPSDWRDTTLYFVQIQIKNVLTRGKIVSKFFSGVSIRYETDYMSANVGNRRFQLLQLAFPVGFLKGSFMTKQRAWLDLEFCPT